MNENPSVSDRPAKASQLPEASKHAQPVEAPKPAETSPHEGLTTPAKASRKPPAEHTLESRVWLLEQAMLTNPKPYSDQKGDWHCSRCNEVLAVGMTCKEEDCPHVAK